MTLKRYPSRKSRFLWPNESDTNDLPQTGSPTAGSPRTPQHGKEAQALPRLRQRYSRLHVSLQLDQLGVQLLDHTVKPEPVYVDRLAYPNLQTVLGSEILRGEVDASAGAQHPEHLAQR